MVSRVNGCSEMRSHREMKQPCGWSNPFKSILQSSANSISGAEFTGAGGVRPVAWAMNMHDSAVCEGLGAWVRGLRGTFARLGIMQDLA